MRIFAVIWAGSGTRAVTVEGAYNDLENLDCKWIGGLHDYMKFIKYGYGRATDQLCIEIRAGRISRDEAVISFENN